MYYSAIGVLALLVLLIENQDVFLNRGDTFGSSAWMVYRRFLFAVTAYYVTDILWGFFESRHMVRMLFADTTVYFMAMAAGILFWTQFTVEYLDENNSAGRFLLNAGRVLSGLIIALTFVNILKPVFFVVDSNCVYRALPARYVMLSAQILLLILIAGYAFSSFLRQDTDEVKRRRYRAFGAFGVIMAVFLFAQLWYPYLPLYAIAYMLGTSMFHTIVVSNEKMEYRQGLEEAARIRELKGIFASLLDNMPSMAFTKDAESGAYLACNQSYAEYAHKPDPDSVLGLTDAEIFDAATAKRFADDDRIALSMDTPYIYYEDVSDAGGSQRQLQMTKLRYTDDMGRQCIMGIYQDVTDMVRIQRENATTKEEYEKIRSTGLIYTHIAQALARSYTDLYYVNLDSEAFIEYRPDEETGMLTEVRRGYHFFEACREEAHRLIHPDDKDNFVEAMDRRTLTATLDRKKTLVMNMRYLSERGPVYVTMKVSRMEDDDRFIIIGINDVDEQMKQQRAAERMREERVAYNRLSALTGDFISVYVVVPETGRYREFSAGAGYEALEHEKEGRDFFGMSRDTALRTIHPDDIDRFLSVYTRENVMAEIERRGFFTLSYRIIMEGEPVYVQLRATMVDEKEGKRLIVGISDIDSQVRQEDEYVNTLAQARMEASVDALTGVKNRHAYLMAEERINIQIEEGRAPEFAVVILDVNDLKTVNDKEGHNAGDKYLRDACMTVCGIFGHSPVFRIGGDEFAVISQGSDYEHMDELIARMREHNEKALREGGIVIACGMSRYEGDSSVAPVFERADQIMYVNKNELKERKADETA